MIAIDTNILLPAVETANPDHERAVAFLDSLQTDGEVAVSELVLIELYGLLRNPQVLSRPVSARDAAAVCQTFRRHPRWQLLGLPPMAALSTTPSGRNSTIRRHPGGGSTICG